MTSEGCSHEHKRLKTRMDTVIEINFIVLFLIVLSYTDVRGANVQNKNDIL
jgi:hypothetical protein